MRTFSDRGRAADRLRAATQSLTNPKDVEVVRQYLHELEEAARQQQKADKSSGSAGNRPSAESGAGDTFGNRTEPNASRSILPLSRTAVIGRLSKERRNNGEDAVWVLKLEEPSQSP